ncbi:MAG: MAPEG family protein [Pseudomonadota bacterium]
MQWTAWITIAALVMVGWTFMNAANARRTYKIKAPAMDGPLQFQSIFRVYANTLEQLAFFLPTLWLCAFYLNDQLAALGGAVWIIGRILYASAYYKDPSKRGLGFSIAFGANALLMAGAIVGLVMHSPLLQS